MRIAHTAMPMKMPPGESAFNAARRQEYTIAVDEIRRQGWRRAWQAAHGRLDQSLAAAVADSKAQIACRAGCSYCCHFKVEIRAEEAFAIVDYVREHFSPERSREIRAAADANARVMRQSSPAEQVAANLRCVFLVDGCCSIYEVRPLRCRAFHATDVERCKESFEQPRNPNILNSLVPEVHTAGQVQQQGYNAAMGELGFDTTMYEMSTALAACFTDTGPKRRFEKGKPAFSKPRSG